MKSLIIISSLLIANLTFAGGSVGTMRVADNDQLMQIIKGLQVVTELEKIKTDPKIIYSTIPSIDGISRVSVGHIDNNKWRFQQLEVPYELLLKSDLSQEIQNSIELNDWVEIQN